MKGSRTGMGSRATIYDVARIAGVSPMTVSRVLNNRNGVAPATAAKVRQAIAEIGFRRHQSASNLRQGQRFITIGLVIEDMASPFYAMVGQGVEEVARREAALLVVSSSEENPSLERDVVLTLYARAVDGLLLFPAGTDHHYLTHDVLQGRPVVFLGRPPHGPMVDTVLVDNVGGAIRATNHLIAHGHRRIGVVGDTMSVYTAERRLEGYRRSHASAGLPADPELERLGCRSVEEATAATRSLLDVDRPPTALFTLNNRMTVGALRALGPARGEIALVGFDDFELADLLTPGITVVAQDPADMGRRAAKLLFGRLADDDAPIQQITLPVHLIPRGSGEVAVAAPN